MPTEGVIVIIVHMHAQRIQCLNLKLQMITFVFGKGHLTAVNFGARVGDFNGFLDQRQGDSNEPNLTSLNDRRIGAC